MPRKDEGIYRGFNLATLGRRQIDAWYLREEGISYKEIAERLNLSIYTIYSYVDRVRSYLRFEEKDVRPFDDFTEEELDHLKWIREIGGKGYIRDYCVKMVHVCSNCGQTKGVQGSICEDYVSPLSCINCGHKFSSMREWTELRTVERWMKI